MENKQISIGMLNELADTFRLIANTYNCEDRGTYLDGKVMVAWNDICDLITDYNPTTKEHIEYYMIKGQIPRMYK